MTGGNDPEDMGPAEVLRASDKALFIHIDEINEDVWVPMACIHEDSEVFDADENGSGDLTIKRWWAVKQGWRTE